MVPLSFADTTLMLRSDHSVFWPSERTLFVADLHLEKGSFYASHGQPLPPYDSRATLEKVTQAIRETVAERVVTLGDNFHDAEGAARLESQACDMLRALTDTVEWVWVTGNHDGPAQNAALAACGGTLVEETEVGGIICRHEAKPGETAPELSGHWHPKLSVSVRGRRVRRPCAVIAGANDMPSRMVLPAFGAFTGGMGAADEAIRDALSPAEQIDAALPVAGKLVRFPLWRAHRRAA